MWKVLYATAIETGPRAGDLYALEVKDIGFARNIIQIRRAVWEGRRQSAKTRNATRAIDVQPSLIALLRQYFDGRTDGLLFHSKNGKPLRNNNVLRRQLHPLLERLGIPQGGMHASDTGECRSWSRTAHRSR